MVYVPVVVRVKNNMDFPTSKHLKEWDIYRLYLVDKIKTENSQLKRSFFEYRIKVLDGLLRLKK